MAPEDPQKIWNEFYERKKSERLAEAVKLWKQMQAMGVTEDTLLALDFLHFGNSRKDVQALVQQLSEHYAMEVVFAKEQGYWHAKGTTRPHGITLNQQQHLDWVGFMSDVARSYACVFSTWSLEAPSLGGHFKSENV